MSDKRVIIILCLISVLFFLFLSRSWLFARNINKSSKFNTISVKKAIKTIEDTMNKYLLADTTVTILKGPQEESGLYKFTIKVENNEHTAYLTKDGKFLIFADNMIDIAAVKEGAAREKQPAEIAKARRPSVELYVMSLCPYGTKAEQMVSPTINAFGDKINFVIKYIVDVKGDTIDDVKSLHGPQEVAEDLRQAAILRYYPDKFWAYLDNIEEKSCLISCGEISLDSYWKTAADKLGMDVSKIESFVNNGDGLDLLKQSGADAKKYGITASPTLVINGVKSNAVYKDSEAVKAAICAAFTSAPEECTGN